MSAEVAGMPLRLPKLGQSMESATIVSWLVAEGEVVSEGQVVVAIETDKATYDLESPSAGPLHILVPEGEEVDVEAVIAIVGAASGTVRPASSSPAAPPVTTTSPALPVSPAGQGASRILASPKAKRLAAELGIGLERITASAADGIISADDVLAAAAEQDEAPAAGETSASSGAGRHEVRREALSGIRKTAARRLQESWQTIPHIVQMVEVNASGLLAERSRLKREGVAASVNDLLLHATARALASVPRLNATLDGNEVVYHEGVDLGFAVETPRGLLVPVVRGADSLSIAELAAEVARLSSDARDSRLKPDDTGGASLTVSNLGMHGIRMGTPVINPGEPALIFVGAIEGRPVAAGMNVVVRPMLTLSIAYDHRLADGVLAASLTTALKAAIESYGAEEPSEEWRVGNGEERTLRSRSDGPGHLVEIEGPRQHGWTLDEPVEENGTDQGATPVEAFLGALLGCLTMSLRAAARRRHIAVERIDGTVAANPKRHISTITVTLEVWSSAPREDLEALLQPAKKGCFVSGVLKDAIDFQVELRVMAPGTADVQY